MSLVQGQDVRAVQRGQSAFEGAADSSQFWLIVRVLETFDIRFVALEKTAGTRRSMKIVDSTGATGVLPTEEPGRGGSGTCTPSEGFTIELRLRAD